MGNVILKDTDVDFISHMRNLRDLIEERCNRSVSLLSRRTEVKLVSANWLRNSGLIQHLGFLSPEQQQKRISSLEGDEMQKGYLEFRSDEARITFSSLLHTLILGQNQRTEKALL